MAASAQIRFILPQFVEQIVATSIIPTIGAAATRAATVLSYPVAGNINVTAPFSIYLEWTPNVSGALPTMSLFSVYINSSNYLEIYLNSFSIWIKTVVAGTTYSSGIASSSVKGVMKKIAVSSNGILQIFVNGAIDATPGTSVALPSGSTTFQVGSHNGVEQVNGCIKNLRIFNRALTDAQLIAMTT